MKNSFFSTSISLSLSISILKREKLNILLYLITRKLKAFNLIIAASLFGIFVVFFSFFSFSCILFHSLALRVHNMNKQKTCHFLFFCSQAPLLLFTRNKMAKRFYSFLTSFIQFHIFQVNINFNFSVYLLFIYLFFDVYLESTDLQNKILFI